MCGFGSDARMNIPGDDSGKWKFRATRDMMNSIDSEYFKKLNVTLVDFKLEFGKTVDGEIVLADEISPDTCRFWDSTTGEKLDKDRFRRDLGHVRETYEEVAKRIANVLK